MTPATEIMNNNVNNNTMREIATKKRGDIYMIDPLSIDIQPDFNARGNFDLTELKAQIASQGVLNPITVVPYTDKATNTERYWLVDGERRYRAVMELLSEGSSILRIKAIFLPKNTKREDMYIQQMMRNEGKRFSTYEEAVFYGKFKNEFGYTQNEIAAKFGKKASYVSACLALLELPTEIQEKLRNGEISVDAVNSIIKNHVGDETSQIEEVEKAVNEAKKQGKKTATKKTLSKQIQVANIISNIRKSARKAATLLTELNNPESDLLMNGLLDIYNSLNGYDAEVKKYADLSNVTENEPIPSEPVNEVVDVEPIEEVEEVEFVEETESPEMALLPETSECVMTITE